MIAAYIAGSNRLYYSIVLLTLFTLILACGPKTKSVETPSIPNVPYAIKAEAGSESAILSWNVDLQDPNRVSGYNIYLANSPEDEGEQFNSAPFPGDTDGDRSKETFEIPRLQNGKRYYAYIRTVLSDGTLSSPSSRISFLPLAQGQIIISQNYTGDQSGFCFAKEKYTKARDFENDLYIFATKSKSGISSPSRLHSSLRESKISLSGGNFEKSQPLQKGKIYILETAENGHVKLTLKNITGSVPQLEATFSYIYYPPGLEPR